MEVSREQVLRYRVHRQALGGSSGDGSADCPVLDIGVQETGPDGAAWALELRGDRTDPAELVYAWTLRGAPHAYRRSEIAQVAAAVAPYSDADARKRTLDAGKQLTAAGITMSEAFDRIATEMRDIVSKPTSKGDLSAGLTARLPAPYLRECRPCDAIHAYEQPFRLCAIRAGLELEPGTSPPVLRRIPGWRGIGKDVPPHLDVIRATLHLLGPADHRLVAGYLDAGAQDVKAHWPDDAVDVVVDGRRLQILAADADLLTDPPRTDVTALLGPFDLFMQSRDRDLVVPEEAARKDLWRVLGRPGGVLVGHEVVGSWRPRSRGKRLQIALSRWDGKAPTKRLAEQAERLATWRGQAFAGWAEA